MRKAVLLTAVACLLALGGQSFAELCTIDAVPAATLLLPYFEVSLNSIDDDPVQADRDVDTFFSVSNASAAPTVAHVVFWGDWSLPSIDFDIFLTGYDVETVSLSDVFNNGNLPITSHGWNDANDDISPHGQNAAGAPHGPNPAWDSQPDNPLNPRFLGCDTNLPLGPNPVLQGSFLDRIRCGHTGRGLACQNTSCIGQRHDETGGGDNDWIARGYITIDNVIDCNLRFPNDVTGYFGTGGVASTVNQLWGDWFIVQDGRAIGDNLVAIEAADLIQYPGEQFVAGDYTYYGRYVGALATDQREPLASTWATRYFNTAGDAGAVFDGGTSLFVWRDSKCQSNVDSYDPPPPGSGGGCNPVSFTPPWWPLDETQVVAFDLQEDATVICTDFFDPGGGVSPPNPTEEFSFCFPLETGRYRVGEGDLDPPYDFGWMYLNLNFTLGSTAASPTPCATTGLFGDIAQSWVNTELDAFGGQFSVGFAGTQLTSACTGTPNNNAVIGPIPATCAGCK